MPGCLEYFNYNKDPSFNFSNNSSNNCGTMFWLVNLAEVMICEIENKVRFRHTYLSLLCQ